MNLLLQLLPPLVFGFAAFYIAQLVTGESIKFAERGGILAQPNHRSSHTQPTPRLGGIGFAAGIVLPLIAFLLAWEPLQRIQGIAEESLDPVQWTEWLGLVAAFVFAFALGFWDDRGNPPALAKLAGQIVVAAIPALCGLGLRQLHLPYVGLTDLPPVIGAIVTFAWFMLMMNVVNFMDGINGLAGRFAKTIGIVLILWAMMRFWTGEILMLGSIITGASSGFLAWNYPRAKTFLGDCGSQPMGALIAGAFLLAANNDLHYLGDRAIYDPFIAAIIAVSPFLFDVLLTLVRRIARGENPLNAHREHLYQRYLVAVGEDHVRTTEFVAWFLYISGAIALLYVRFTTPTPEDAPWRVLLIVAAIVNLGAYYIKTSAVKKRNV